VAAPPSINLLGEIRLLNRLVSWSWFRMLILMLLPFLRAACTLYLFSYSQHGLRYSGLYVVLGCGGAQRCF
jgi:NADH-ubiquinone oxidoreductase chain 4